MSYHLAPAMSRRTLTPAQQNDILSQCPWNPDGTVTLQCRHHTAPLLRLAGITNPQPLHKYPLQVRRNAVGLLVLAPQATAKPAAATAPHTLPRAAAIAEINIILRALRA